MVNAPATVGIIMASTRIMTTMVTSEEYMQKLEHFVAGRTYGVLKLHNQGQLQECFEKTGKNYKRKA